MTKVQFVKENGSFYTNAHVEGQLPRLPGGGLIESQEDKDLNESRAMDDATSQHESSVGWFKRP